MATTTSSEQHYSLRWNDYTVKIVTAFQSLREEEDFVDVTVACDGHHYSAHKMVLSACSPYFRSLLRANPCQHPIVILKDVGHIEMERLLEFMYNGEVNIAQDQLAAFLKTAETLRIRGLAGSSDELDQNLSRDSSSHNLYSCMTNTSGNATTGRISPNTSQNIYSCMTNTSGSIPGRISPNVSFSQECKDDDITSDGIFHISSPAAKRRKRTPDIHVIANVDNSTSHTNDSLTGDSLIDESTGTDSVLDLEDHRLDRRELKSEPSDALADYVNSSDLHDQHDALPGPSGSLLGSQDDPLSSNGLIDEAEAPSSLIPSYLNYSWNCPSRTAENQCLVCFKSFSNRGSMTRHLRDQHLQPGATVSCDLCGKICKNRNCLITHRSVAHSGRRKVRVFPQTLVQHEGLSPEAEAAIHKIVQARQDLTIEQSLL